MRQLGDFLREQLWVAPTLPSTSSIACLPKLAALQVLHTVLPADKADRMAAAIEGYASSDEFAAEVNRAVLPPKADESEDEYVERAKKEVRRILLRKFG